MRRFLTAAILLTALALAKDKKLPTGTAGNELIQFTGTVLDVDELKQLFGTDFGENYVVIDATLAPRSDKPCEVHLDDFLMRSEQTGEHTGPVVASQIAGSNTIVFKRPDAPASRGGFGGGFGGIMMGGGGVNMPPANPGKAEVKTRDGRNPLLDVLNRKILPEKPITETVSGLLFFPMEKEKPKNLVLIYTTPSEQQDKKLRIKFK